MLETLRVLVVEDEPSDFALIERTLGRLESFNVEIELARDLPAARQAAKQTQFDAALIDFFVRGDCGLDLVPELVARHGQCAPILLTGQLTQTVHTHALRAGVLASLPKDNLDPRLLEVALRHALQNRNLVTRLLNCLGELAHANDEKLELVANFTRLMASSLEAVVNCAYGIEHSVASHSDRAHLMPQVRSLCHLASDLRHYCRETSAQLGGRQGEDEDDSVVDLQAALSDVVHVVSQRQNRRQADITIAFQEHPVFVYGNEASLLRALTDLLQACLLHLAPKGRIEIMVAANDDRICLGICSKDFSARPDNIRLGGALRVVRSRALLERDGGSVEIQSTPAQDGYVVLVALKPATHKDVARRRYRA
jgi:CheY-like chemotaxis protein